MNKILLSMLLLSSISFASDYQYENRHLDKLIDIDDSIIKDYKTTDSLNLTNHVNLANVSNNIWVEDVFSEITMNRFLELPKHTRDLIKYKDFHDIEVTKLRNEFFQNNSKKMNKNESLQLYIKIFDLKSKNKLLSNVNRRLEPFKYYKILEYISAYGNNKFMLHHYKKELNDVEKNNLNVFNKLLNEYSTEYNYGGKIRANILIGKLLKNININDFIFKQLLVLEPTYDTREVELFGSYYSIFSRINLNENQKKLIIKTINRYDDKLIKLISIQNTKFLDNNKLKKYLFKIKSIDRKIIDKKYMINKSTLVTFIETINK